MNTRLREKNTNQIAITSKNAQEIISKLNILDLDRKNCVNNKNIISPDNEFPILYDCYAV